MPRNIGKLSAIRKFYFRNLESSPIYPAQAIACQPVAVISRGVATSPKPRCTFGQKVIRLLAYRKSRGLEPSSEAALARAVGIDSGTVYKWGKVGTRPRTDIGQKVAEALGVDFAWLSDPSRPFEDPDKETQLKTVLSLIPEAEQNELARVLADPVERRAWLAHWRARHGRTQP